MVPTPPGLFRPGQGSGQRHGTVRVSGRHVGPAVSRGLLLSDGGVLSGRKGRGAGGWLSAASPGDAGGKVRGWRRSPSPSQPGRPPSGPAAAAQACGRGWVGPRVGGPSGPSPALRGPSGPGAGLSPPTPVTRGPDELETRVAPAPGDPAKGGRFSRPTRQASGDGPPPDSHTPQPSAPLSRLSSQAPVTADSCPSRNAGSGPGCAVSSSPCISAQ